MCIKNKKERERSSAGGGRRGKERTGREWRAGRVGAGRPDFSIRCRGHRAQDSQKRFHFF